MKVIKRFWKSCLEIHQYLKTHKLRAVYRRRLFFLMISILICLLVVPTIHQLTRSATPSLKNSSSIYKNQGNHSHQASPKSNPASRVKRATPKKIDWTAPSEKKPYPNPKKWRDISLHVDISKQRVFVKEKTKLLYTMYASTGIKDSTPRGNFAIQKERGKCFFNTAENKGACYYTSFYQHGIYLFHTIPTGPDGKYLSEEGAQLGKSARSHGCILLSVSDAKWIFSKVPNGTLVRIY